MKKLISVLFALLLLLPTAAYAKQVYECNDWEYILQKDGTA